IEGNYHAVSYPANVHSFPDEAPSSFTFTKQHERVEITGFSYETRAVTEEKVLQFPERDPAATYQICMLHSSGFCEKQHTKNTPIPRTRPICYLSDRHVAWFCLWGQTALNICSIFNPSTS